ncbi:MAG: HK97 family phage prohead protease, partial [Methylococcaceae bacterium]|nr:HK97 family phage prohead protease [Methylococcaceae bacterium]
MPNEFRSFPFEIRAEGEGKEARIVGHAAIFNTFATIWDFREQVAPGAFRKSIGEDDIRALFNHDANYVLGRNRAGTLKLSEDEKG